MKHSVNRPAASTWRRALGLLAAASLVFAACGDDDDASPTEDTGSVEQPTGTPLRIGLLVDQTSPQAPGQEEAAEVAQAWAAEVNADGGIAEHPVEIVVRDSKGDAPSGSTAAQELIGDASVIATLVVDSTAEAAFVPALSEAGLPVVGGVGYNPTVWGALPNVFGITTSFPSVVNEQVMAAKESGASKAAVAACAEVAACAAAAPIFQAATGKLGLEYGGVVQIAADAPDYVAECLQFIDDGVDFIQLSAPGAVVQRLASDCATQGYDGVFGASAGTVNAQLYADFPADLAGGLNAFPWWVDDAPVQEFRDVMEAQDVSEETYGNPIATGTYASLELFRHVVEENAATLGDAPDRAAILAAYGTVADETLGGLLPNPVTFTAGQPGPAITCFWLYEHSEGEFTGDFTPTCPGPELG